MGFYMQGKSAMEFWFALLITASMWTWGGKVRGEWNLFLANLAGLSGGLTL